MLLRFTWLQSTFNQALQCRKRLPGLYSNSSGIMGTYCSAYLYDPLRNKQAQYSPHDNPLPSSSNPKQPLRDTSPRPQHISKAKTNPLFPVRSIKTHLRKKVKRHPPGIIGIELYQHPDHKRKWAQSMPRIALKCRAHQQKWMKHTQSSQRLSHGETKVWPCPDVSDANCRCAE
ncbi:uncharacterized protein BDV17DRAFT_91453 [Aspergillus undulatus]|uniref:uncharacterized protein n=1 Tax=Aspergillus undulatus TaxID=1810928 RepID=UPI003CCC9ECF